MATTFHRLQTGTHHREGTADGKGDRVAHHAALTLVLLAVLLLHARSLPYPLIYDDLHIVKNNPFIRDLSHLGEFFLPWFWRVEWPNRSYRPVVEATLALNWAAGEWVGGMLGVRRELAIPAALRAVNILLLAADCALLYLLVRRLSGSLLAASAAGLVCALHPMHLETIGLIKNRSELLLGLFVLGALLCYLRAAEGRGNSWLNLSGVAVLTTLAMGSKEQALILPFLLTLAGLLLVVSRRRGKALAFTVPVWLLACAFAALLLHLRPTGHLQYQRETDLESVLTLRAMSPGRHVLVVVKTVGIYLGLLLWPFDPCVERTFIIPDTAFRWDVALSLVGIVLWGVMVLRWWVNRPMLAFAALWTALAIAPVSNIIPIAVRPVGEHRLFGATLGFSLLCGLAVGRLWRGMSAARRRRGGSWGAATATVLVGVWFCLMGATTLERLADWRSGLALWGRAAGRSPRAWRAAYNYGAALIEAGRFREALEQFRRALPLEDLRQQTLVGLAHALSALGHLEPAGRISRLALAWNPADAGAHTTLANILLKEGHLQEALAEASRAIELDPSRPRAHEVLGVALARMGRYKEATGPLRRAWQLNRRFIERWLNLASALELSGRTRQALHLYREVLRRFPGDPKSAIAREGVERLRQSAPVPADRR